MYQYRFFILTLIFFLSFSAKAQKRQTLDRDIKFSNSIQGKKSSVIQNNILKVGQKRRNCRVHKSIHRKLHGIDKLNKFYFEISSHFADFDACGGIKKFKILSSDSWHISTRTYNWGKLYVNGDTLTLEVEQNNNREPRSDYFTLRSGKHTLRVDIKQSNENSSHKAPETETQILTEPMAEIIKVWADYNIYNNSLKGMNIHTKFSTSDEIRKRIYMIIAFYYSDNKSNLKNKDGKNLQFEFDDISPYQFSLWPDVSIFVPYTDLNMSSGFKGILSYDIIILDENSHLLARSENHVFVYSNQ